jgi:hypothetical protein
VVGGFAGAWWPKRANQPRVGVGYKVAAGGAGNRPDARTDPADPRAEHNAQKLKIGCYAACVHKRDMITANP